jgi:hypothetical protein
VYPTTDIGEIPWFLDTLKDAGVQEIWIDMLRLKPGVWENVRKTLQQDLEISRRFSKPMQQPLEYYSRIRGEMQKQGKQRNLRIIDAF